MTSGSYRLITRQPGQFVADVIYTPLETEFLGLARGRGARVMGGAGMCVHQAAEAFPVGHVFQAQCWTTGGNVNAAPYGAKNNNLWIRFTGRRGTEYFPDAWARLDDGRDNINVLPHC